MSRLNKVAAFALAGAGVLYLAMTDVSGGSNALPQGHHLSGDSTPRVTPRDERLIEVGSREAIAAYFELPQHPYASFADDNRS
jgi:hypothetical protein